jgi:catechol 2,3-dioxygenase-like lactoylglutathione lyase family enzyme
MNILKPHVSLNVSNIDASVAFYEKVFAVSPAKRRPGYAKFDLANECCVPSVQGASKANGGCCG